MKHLAQLKLAFLLSLGLLGSFFWLAGTRWTQHYLGVAKRPTTPLLLSPETAIQSHGVLSIRATLSNQRPFTYVEIVVVQPVARTLSFYLPTRSPAAIEARLTQYLQVPAETIHNLIRYEGSLP